MIKLENIQTVNYVETTVEREQWAVADSGLYEGDLAVVMNLMEKMHGRIQDLHGCAPRPQPGLELTPGFYPGSNEQHRLF